MTAPHEPGDAQATTAPDGPVHPDDPPGPVASPEILAELASLRAAIESRVDTLITSMAHERERAAFRESVIDRLHEENQRLRRGEWEALIEPVRAGLFRVHDMARKAAAQSRPAARQSAALLDAVADEAADVLVGLGVQRFEAVAGEGYDQLRHRPVGTMPVDERWREGTVAEVRTAGFATAHKILRRADVVVARFTGDDEAGHDSAGDTGAGHGRAGHDEGGQR